MILRRLSTTLMIAVHPIELAVVAVAAAGSLCGAAAQENSSELKLVPEAVSHISWPGLEGALKVRLPASWTPARKWPVLFYYHGTGGSPTISLPVAYTGGDGFVIVGMTYSIKGTVNISRFTQFYMDTARIMGEVRDHLSDTASVDPERVYVGGFSKGGWTAAHFADKYPDLIAGAIILGAGVNPNREGEELPRFRTGTPVYVGVGQLEFNYAVSLQSVDHYGKRGAEVTLDVYDGLGHRPATDPRSEYLEQWLAIEANRDSIKELKPSFEAWRASLGEKVADTADPVLQYLILDRAGNAPFARFLTKTQKRGFSARLEALKMLPAVAAEVGLRSRHASTRRREADGGFRLANWEDVIHDYATTYRRNPNATFGRRAGLDALRVLELIREAMRQRARGGTDATDFLEENTRFVGELDAIPKSELRGYFGDLRRTVTIPLTRNPNPE